MNAELEMVTKELFSLNAAEILDGGEATDSLYESLKEKANRAINRYGWETVFASWKNFMIANCDSVESALNFATWFEIYGGNKRSIPEPYAFLAYLYDIFDLNPVKYDAQIMDDVSYGVLEASGVKKDLWLDDYYTTETDPDLIAAVVKLREMRKKDDNPSSVE